MSAWLVSLNGAISLSVLAFLTLIARITFLDAMFVPEFRMMLPEDRPVGIVLMMAGLMLFAGGWVWSLLAAGLSRRAGLIVSLIYCLFTALGGGLLTLLVLCPAGCAAPPVGNFIVWANLISGLCASLALGIQLRQPLVHLRRVQNAIEGETA